MKIKRALRVAELIRRDLSQIITTEVRDPFVKSIIITHVKLSDDLKIAKIYYRLLKGNSINEKNHAALERVSKYIRLELARRAEFRSVPELKFFYDSGLDEANRIDFLLEKLRKSQAE